MDELIIANKRLKTAHEHEQQNYDALMSKLEDTESKLTKRLDELNQKKHKVAEANGNVNAADDDLIEINAGGGSISAKRSTLTQLKGTRVEALFSGRWDKKLQRDPKGRIFLDFNPSCFQALVDYLSELAISSDDCPPKPPSVDDEELKHILKNLLELLGLIELLPAGPIDSTIFEDKSKAALLHKWLKEDGSDGKFRLLYCSSRDGLSDEIFHSKCDNKGSTLTIIETTDGHIIGGYSNTPWKSLNTSYVGADKAFLFNLLSAQKMKLKNPNDVNAVLRSSSLGPVFGMGNSNDNDLKVTSQYVYPRFGSSYEAGSSSELTRGDRFAIKKMEVFQVTSLSGSIAKVTKQKHKMPKIKMPTTRFSDDVNKRIDRKRACLLQAELEVDHLEHSFKNEQTFIEKFACGVAKDVVALNVSGTVMVTTRSTLCVAEDSVLAQQFDDSKWTEQYRNVKGWTSEEVGAWVKKIDNVSETVAAIFVKNDIKGNELLAMNMEGLKMIGIERAGTLCLLLEEIKKLKQSSQDIATLIEHGPYCFGKILDYLRLTEHYSRGLITEEPELPEVSESQQHRFEKVAKYYFPGDSSKFILG